MVTRLRLFHLIAFLTPFLLTACDDNTTGTDDDDTGNGGDAASIEIISQPPAIQSRNGGELFIEIRSNSDYSVIIPESDKSWISVNEYPPQREEEGVSFVLQTNDTAAERSTTVTFRSEDLTAEESIDIRQKGTVLPVVTFERVRYTTYGDTFIEGTIDHLDGEPSDVSYVGIDYGENQGSLDNPVKHHYDGSGRFEIPIFLSDGIYNSGKKYYFRVWAMLDGEVYSYGAGDSFIAGQFTDLDGNFYTAMVAGKQIWMKENLRTTRFADNSGINSWVDGAIDEEPRYHASNFLNDLGGRYTVKSVYGYWYNWHAATDERNICPPGWHVPADTDWRELREHVLLGDNMSAYMLKMPGEWPNQSGKEITNSTRFSAYPNGYVGLNGKLEEHGDEAHFWSSTQGVINFSTYGVTAEFYNDDYFRIDNNNKLLGKAIRCVKD